MQSRLKNIVSQLYFSVTRCNQTLASNTMSNSLKPNFEYLSCTDNYGCGADAVYKDLSLHCVGAPSSSPQQCYVVTKDNVLKVPTVISAPVFADKNQTLSAPSNGCVVERASHNGRDVIMNMNCAPSQSRTTTFLSAIANQPVDPRLACTGSVESRQQCEKLRDKGTYYHDNVKSWVVNQHKEGSKHNPSKVICDYCNCNNICNQSLNMFNEKPGGKRLEGDPETRDWESEVTVDSQGAMIIKLVPKNDPSDPLFKGCVDKCKNNVYVQLPSECQDVRTSNVSSLNPPAWTNDVFDGFNGFDGSYPTSSKKEDEYPTYLGVVQLQLGDKKKGYEDLKVQSIDFTLEFLGIKVYKFNGLIKNANVTSNIKTITVWLCPFNLDHSPAPLGEYYATLKIYFKSNNLDNPEPITVKYYWKKN